MYTLKRRVCFYETDGMQVAHHANYLRWIEEARVEYFRAAKLELNDLMVQGIVFPIMEVRVEYKKSAYHDDLLEIRTYLREVDRAKFIFTYEVYREVTGELLATAYTKGTFTDSQTGKIKRLSPELIAPLQALAVEDRLDG